MEPRHLLLWISTEFKGNWQKMYECIKKQEKPSLSSEELVDFAEKFNEKYISLMDEDYPKILKECTDGTIPFVLYYRGDISLLKDSRKKLAVIGSRKCSKYGEKTTRSIIDELDENVIIVSGLAKGIDSIAIEEALNTKKKVIAVIGNSIDTVYPSNNDELFKRVVDEGGVIVSEYPPGTELDPDNFRWRNRIVAGLADLILVSEAYDKSGCSITVGYGLNFGKSVCCIPFPARVNSFCNVLIREGAYLVETGSDVEKLF